MEKKIIVNEEDVVWEEGMTVRRVLEVKKYTFKLLVITIDGQLIPKDKYDETIVPEGSEVKVMHLMSGG